MGGGGPGYPSSRWLHTVVGAGAAEGALDAGNRLPMLARGELRAVGATTWMARKHIEKMPPWEAFSAHLVQPFGEDTVPSCGAKGALRVHHGVRFKMQH